MTTDTAKPPTPLIPLVAVFVMAGRSVRADFDRAAAASAQQRDARAHRCGPQPRGTTFHVRLLASVRVLGAHKGKRDAGPRDRQRIFAASVSICVTSVSS